MSPTSSTRFRRVLRALRWSLLLAVILSAAWLTHRLLRGPSANPIFDGGPPGGPPSLAVQDPGAPRPNVVLINCDDLGYGDLGCYGATAIRTPNADRLAAEGLLFTNFYACNSVCTPSRAGLLTGRYPQRSGMTWILFPEDDPAPSRVVRNVGELFGELGLVDFGPSTGTTGLPASELTLAELLREAGYRTGMIGKWHLGDFSREPRHNPLRHGFDSFFGVPHSNDMQPFPLYRGEKQLEADVADQSRLTGLYTGEAVAFLERQDERPFFLYLAHTFPHQPLSASEPYRGSSLAGLYGDTVEELDASLGRILAALDRSGLAANTLVLFTSDNGPWFEGDPGHLRGRKGQSYEGGFRVPLIARYPARIPAGRECDAPASNLDVFPTCLELAGLAPLTDRIIDGRSLLGLLAGETTESAHEALYFYHLGELEAVRAGRWKYIRNIHHYVWPVPVDKETTAMGGIGKGKLGRWPLLHDLGRDASESYNLIDHHPERGAALEGLMEAWETEMRDNPRGWLTP